MKVAVLGSSGGMGSFFVRYFLARGDEVRGSDLKKPRRAPAWKGFTFSPSNARAARGSDVTLIASPIERTVEVAQEVASALAPGSTLVEITSVKERVVPALERVIAGRGVRLLSLHPLFGPALESTKGMKIAVAVAAPGGGDAELARKLFPEARIIPMSREEHDRTMAVVLSLTHLLNFVYASTVSRFLSPEEFARVSTPNSSMQLTLAEAVLAQDPNLCYNIQVGNSNSAKVAEAAAEELRRVVGVLERTDPRAFEEYLSGLARTFRIRSRGGAVIREVYSRAGERQAEEAGASRGRGHHRRNR